ncbi:MAG: tRNA lysidine(34) synthetase TilS [Gammaproteobacteria bacterium]|nr:tRNA lysidine(34) synthetase TilS [Gammaproteobacteria bacterium]
MAVTTPHSKVIQSVLSGLNQAPGIKRYWLAYSGGIDSHVLLHVLANHQHVFGDAEFHAVHINHALSPHAEQWAEHCRLICGRLQIPYTGIDVDATPRAGESPEARAREVRYEAMKRLIKTGDCLLTAHHQDDQVETLLLQLMRGSGPKGLAAMPQWTRFHAGHLARPLIHVRREDIHAYAVASNLKWITDESNLNIRFDRNFIRHEIVPRLLQRWPSLAQTVSRSARYCAETVEILDHDARQALREINPDGLPYLPVGKLLQLSKARQHNVLRYWIHGHGMNTPNSHHLEQLVAQLLHAAQDALPKVSWEGCEIRRYRDQLHIMPTLAAIESDKTVRWNIANPMVIDGIGRLSARPGAGEGIGKKYIAGANLHVRFRRGGESIQPAGRPQHHALKKLFQEKGIPPWIRDRIPLIYINDHLAAVGDLFISQQFHADEGEDGYIIQWESGCLAASAQVTDLC